MLGMHLASTPVRFTQEVTMPFISRLLVLVFALLAVGGAAAQEIKIGLVAALTGQSAQSGEAITRGLTIAIDELNARGGISGRKIVLIRRDDESSPPKGVAAARELISNEKVAALFGGIDTPVSLAIVPIVNQAKVPFMGVWAAGTNITKNGANPNYVFRVSAQDDLVDIALLRYASTKFGTKKPGLVLINNPWGESNERGLKAAAAAANLAIAGIEKIEQSDVDVTPQLTRLKNAGADSLILVANAAPGAQMMKARERMGWKVPVISHWGISGGRFDELVGPTAGDAHFVQTYSFFGKLNEPGKRVMSEMSAKYGVKGPADVLAPVGTANAYDAMHLLAKAIEKARSTDGEAIRKAMYEIDQYDGLIKTYKKPFGPDDHEGLAPEDYIMVRFDGSRIVPVQ
jgi:branched-chain amino acid transport system substrate-binding protein